MWTTCSFIVTRLSLDEMINKTRVLSCVLHNGVYNSTYRRFDPHVLFDTATITQKVDIQGYIKESTRRVT